MKWDDQQESENVEDRRDTGGDGGGRGGLGGRTGLAISGFGGLVVIILALVFGVDPQQLAALIGQGPNPAGQQPDAQERPANPEEDRLAHFAKVIFHDTEEVWDDIFHRMGKQYPKPTLVLFTGQVESACGEASTAVGPFYCGGDSRVYIDLAFYDDMEKKLNAPGEFARAYVIAHEVGHHVQRLLGYSRAVEEARRARQDEHKMSVRLELQADFLAGVWAYNAQKKFNFLERGDVESALNAAFQIGDDRLQKKARGYVVPDTFTHGTSKQRMRWFKEGFDKGDVDQARQLFQLQYDDL
jgi:predicted metalloprotease